MDTDYGDMWWRLYGQIGEYCGKVGLKSFPFVAGDGNDSSRLLPRDEFLDMLRNAYYLKHRHSESDEATVAVLQGYLPKQLDEDELRGIIGGLVESGAAMGQIMGYLKTHYGGSYDGRAASSIAKSLTE